MPHEDDRASGETTKICPDISELICSAELVAGISSATLHQVDSVDANQLLRPQDQALRQIRDSTSPDTVGFESELFHTGHGLFAPAAS
jgi:hypothetical protein